MIMKMTWTSGRNRTTLIGGKSPSPDQEKNDMTIDEKALQPEDLTRLFVERANAGDAAGLAALYEEGAVMAYPPGDTTVRRAAIQALWEQVLAHAPTFEPETPLPTLVSGDIALTATPARDGKGARAQVV